MSDLARRGTAPSWEGETVAAWFERYFDWRASQPHAESVRKRRAAVQRWIVPVIGTEPMASVTSDRIRDFVHSLEQAVSSKRIRVKS